jgi:hypothetical protein
MVMSCTPRTQLKRLVNDTAIRQSMGSITAVAQSYGNWRREAGSGLLTDTGPGNATSRDDLAEKIAGEN